jgi:hypothetical protein
MAAAEATQQVAVMEKQNKLIVDDVKNLDRRVAAIEES